MTITRLLKFPTGRLMQMKFAGFVFLLCLASQVNAQSVTVTGTVSTADDGLGLPSANVMIKGTAVGTATDLDGNYSINANANDVLVFSYTGFAAQEIAVGSNTVINVSLAASALELDDVVVIGYGTQKKADLTGSVAVVDVDDADNTVTYDVAKMLQGQVAGVTVQSSGEPGGFVNIKIRGMSSFSNNNPLFVIDGMIINDPYDFAPGDIESIQVLKDASSAAIYGVRGANGVVIITTKKGKAGKTSINYRTLIGFQNVGRDISLTNREQYQEITNAAMVNSNQDILPANNPNSEFFIDDFDTDWQDAAFQTGIIQNHNLTFSGGAETMNYNLNIDYFKNTGYVDSPQAYERIATTLNIGGQKGRFKYGGKMGYTNSDKENFNEYLAGQSAILNLVQAIPTMPVYDANRLGGYGGADNATQRAITLNVVGFNNLLQNESLRSRFIGNVWGEAEILKGLRYTLRVTGDRLDTSNRRYIPESDLGWYYVTEEAESSLDVNNSFLIRTVIDNLVNYDFELGKNKFELLAGMVMERNSFYNHWSRGVGYNYEDIPHIEYADAVSAGEYESTETRKSYLGRINYSFDDRYLLQVNFRQDSSSLFPEYNNTGNYFSVSGGWKVNNDIQLPEWWNTLKVRGGYGTLGNNTIGPYDFSAIVNPFASYVFGNTLAPGTTVVELKDPNIKWEDTTTLNVALEFGMFNNKLQFTTEYFVKTSDDLLLGVPLPYSTGSFPATVDTNAGKVRNTGFEFSATYSNQDNPFKYDISANFGTLKNEVLALTNDNLPISQGNFRTEVGRAIGDIYVWETDGIFQNQAEIDAHATQPNARPGDIRFKDIDGDGVITSEDRTYQGSTIPTISYGFNFNASYKAWDFSMFFQGAAGNKVYNGLYNALMVGGLTNHHTDMLNYWSPDNTNTNVPRPDETQANQNARASNRFIEDGDYLRLQNIQLGYTVPFKENKLIQKLRLYVSGQNVFTLTGYKGYDPDFMNNGLLSRGYDGGSFPNPRTVLFGVEASF